MTGVGKGEAEDKLVRERLMEASLGYICDSLLSQSDHLANSYKDVSNNWVSWWR